MSTTASELEQPSLLERKEFMYALGLAFGMMLGIAIGYYVAYQGSLHYAAQSISDYLHTLPPECQAVLNGSSQQVLMPINIKLNNSWGVAYNGS